MSMLRIIFAGAAVLTAGMANAQIAPGGGGGGATLGANIFTGQQNNSSSGAASTPASTWTGSVFTGGSTTTTKPLVLLEPTGATSTGWNTAGTFLGVNAASGFTGYLADFQLNGVTAASISGAGNFVGNSYNANGTAGVSFQNTGVFSGVAGGAFSLGTTISSSDVFLTRAAAATWRLGQADIAAPVAQTVRVQNVLAGTSNTAGVNLTHQGSRGTGTGIGGSIIFQVSPPGLTGSTQNPLVTGLTIDGTTGYPILPAPVTVATLPTCNAAARGALGQVSDATAPAYNVGLTGGGAVFVPVYCNGSAWTSH